MANVTDEKNTDAEAIAFGVRAIASAVLASPSASDGAVSLAILVLEGTANPDVNLPREAGSIAAVFNAQMDAVLDAANDSHGKRMRTTRRTMMASALDRAGLVLMDRATVAALIDHRIGRDSGDVIA